MVDVQSFKVSARAHVIFWERTGEWTAEVEDGLGWQYCAPFRPTQMETIHDLKVLALQRELRLELSTVPTIVRGSAARKRTAGRTRNAAA